jgi:high-affinity K+ transport system ATPase subunit B
MKHEEELQHQVERGSVIHDSEDALAYQRVFDSLKKEPGFHLSLPFADRIVALIEKKEERKDYGWMAAGIFLSVISLIVVLAITKVNWTIGAFTFISKYYGLVGFSIVFILLLQWVDKKLIKKRFDLR